MADVISFTNLLNKDIPPVKYLVDGLIPEAALVYMCGPPGTFKTNFLLYASMLGADGQKVFQYNVPRKFKTLWVDEENREIGMKDKMLKIKNGIDFKDVKSLDENHVIISSDFVIGSDSISKLELWIEEYKPDMVVIDSVAKVFPFKEGEVDDVKLIYTLLGRLIEKHKVSIVLIHHARKKSFGQKGLHLEDMAGSREFGAMADSVIMSDTFKRAGTFMLKQVKNRYGMLEEPINFKVESDAYTIKIRYDDTVSNKYKQLKSDVIMGEIVKWIKKTPQESYTFNEVKEAMEDKDFKRSNIKKAMDQLVKSKYFDYKFNSYRVKNLNSVE